jgi:hypothetical protein
MPPRARNARVTRWRGATRVLPKQAVPRYAGLRSIAQTMERSHRVPGFRVATRCSLSQRVIAPMLKPATV